MSGLMILLIVYLVIVIILGISICFDEHAYNDFIRLKDIESLLDILLFVFSGPSILFANIFHNVFKVIRKALTCKFRERK